jgi:flagellar biosynthesis protein FlhA
MPNHGLARNPGLAEEEIEGVPTTEPAFGLQALWVTKANRDRAERLGYTLVEPSAVLATHLTEIIIAHADELLTREDTFNLLENLKATASRVVEELVPNILSLGEVQKVLHNLLRERVSIRNLQMILEVLADYGTRTKDADILSEYARHALAREICAEYKDENGVLRVVTLSPALEKELLDALQEDSATFTPLDPARREAIAQAAVKAVQPLVQAGHDPVVLTSAQVRRFFKRMVEAQMPKLVVLSYNEIDPAVSLESAGTLEA